MSNVNNIIRELERIENPRDYELIGRFIKKATAKARRSKQETVFLCFNIRKGKIINQAIAMEYCRHTKELGYLPISPFQMFKGVFDTQIKEELLELEEIARSYMTRCNEVWVIGDEITRVMDKQLEFAMKKNMVVRYFTESFEEYERI